ncbi:MAG TPA: 3'-5' exonuclease [Casimicrobiaceae bacterium]|nr:3'-5' exonuclease [Casimicrobiaceae bacterium]
MSRLFFRDREDDASAIAQRWVVVDCEATGLDLSRARLLSIGAVTLVDGRIPVNDTFDVRVSQTKPSDRASIVIHGISPSEQSIGLPPAEAIAAFHAFAADSPFAAFHAPFDRQLLEREAIEARLPVASRRWLDLADLLPILYGDPQRTSLDDWLAAFAIRHTSRHDALGDAFATAQLLQIALAEASRHGYDRLGKLLRAASARRWLSL